MFMRELPLVPKHPTTPNTSFISTEIKAISEKKEYIKILKFTNSAQHLEKNTLKSQLKNTYTKTNTKLTKI